MFVRSLVVAAALALASSVSAQEDVLSIPGPIVFQDVPFEFAWSSHPTESYYKHEYVPEGQKVERYEQMFMIDVVAAGQTPAQAAAGMVTGLDERKGTDPVVNYEIIQNEATGEYILDFLLSDETSGELIVEWNAYRYVPWKSGVALYGISHRAYGADAASAFLGELGTLRGSAIAALAEMTLPEPVVAD